MLIETVVKRLKYGAEFAVLFLFCFYLADSHGRLGCDGAGAASIRRLPKHINKKDTKPQGGPIFWCQSNRTASPCFLPETHTRPRHIQLWNPKEDTLQDDCDLRETREPPKPSAKRDVSGRQETS